MKKIVLTFEWDGSTVHKDVNGFKSNTCLKETDFIDKALGTVVSVTKKPEFFIPVPVEDKGQVYVNR